LLLHVCLRVNGLMFLMPGRASPDPPSAFALPVAYGDLTAVILAIGGFGLSLTGSLFLLEIRSSCIRETGPKAVGLN